MKKGQEEAPIELLIAVTILTFVLIIGFYTYQNTCRAQFEQKMRASLSKFASDLELVYQGAQGTSRVIQVDFTPIGCPGSISGVRLVKGTSDRCLAQLGIPDCLFIVVTTPSKEITFIQPVNIPSDTNIRYFDEGVEICFPNSLTDYTEDDIMAGTIPPACEEWGTQYYAFTVTKTSPGELTIERG